MKARLANKIPALESGEVPIKIDVAVPNALFQRSQLQAKIVMPESAVTPPVLDATVLDNVRDILEQQTGLDIRVSVIQSSEI